MKTLWSSDASLNGKEFFRNRALNHAVKLAELDLNKDNTFKGTPTLVDSRVSGNGDTGYYAVEITMSNKSASAGRREYQIAVNKDTLLEELYNELTSKITAASMAGLNF